MIFKVIFVCNYSFDFFNEFLKKWFLRFVSNLMDKASLLFHASRMSKGGISKNAIDVS